MCVIYIYYVVIHVILSPHYYSGWRVVVKVLLRLYNIWLYRLPSCNVTVLA